VAPNLNKKVEHATLKNYSAWRGSSRGRGPASQPTGRPDRCNSGSAWTPAINQFRLCVNHTALLRRRFHCGPEGSSAWLPSAHKLFVRRMITADDIFFNGGFALTSPFADRWFCLLEKIHSQKISRPKHISKRSTTN